MSDQPDIKISVLTPTIRGKEALKPNEESLARQTFKDFEWLVEEGDGSKHDLNAAFNRMIKRATGSLLVFMEDYTRCGPDGLQKFWDAYQSDPSVFWTAPLGKTLDWKENLWDWRAFQDAEDVGYSCWEIDWGAAPKDALYSVGGFDEELDKYWSGDNVSVAYRAYLHGFKFRNLFNNPAVAFDHDQVLKHPFRQNFNPAYSSERLNSFKPNEKLTYLNAI